VDPLAVDDHRDLRMDVDGDAPAEIRRHVELALFGE
jgi:hypothetical protein